MLGFEKNIDNEIVEIHGDKEGLLHLAEVIKSLVEGEDSEDAHFMSREWGGDMEDTPQCRGNRIINFVKIYYWND